MDYKNKMKTLGFLTAIFVSLSVGAGPEISAQDYVPTPVTVSKEKVKVDGKLYYSHIVLERQTLYSICKAYGVTAAEVYEANPTLIDTGLKKNAIILIPVSGQVTDRNTTVKEGKDTTDTAKGKPAKQKKKKKEKEGDFIVHTVRWYEDLDVISEKYGVPVEAIMQANGLSGRKLSNRQKLKIPAVATPLPEEVGNAEETAPADTTETAADTLNRHALFPGIPAGKKKVDAILMLPFNAGAERPSEGNMDFYCGALLAVKGTPMYPLLKELRKLDGVISCFSFGDSHHLAYDPAKTQKENILAAAVAAGFKDCTAWEIKPGIEDCFMQLSEQ